MKRGQASPEKKGKTKEKEHIDCDATGIAPGSTRYTRGNLPGEHGERRIGMRNEEFISLRELVYEKSGIYFSDNKAYLLENRLKGRLNELNLSTFQNYYYYLRYGEKAAEELFNLFDVVTTNETSFFRNPPQLEMLKLILRSEHLNGEKRSETLRVWSAGCSTGQEPYTIAIIILEEMETLRARRPFAILGTDLSRKALLSAQTAVFNSYAMQHVAAPTREKYFTKVRNGYTINDSVKAWVKFEFMNMNDTQAYRKARKPGYYFFSERAYLL